MVHELGGAHRVAHEQFIFDGLDWNGLVERPLEGHVAVEGHALLAPGAALGKTNHALLEEVEWSVSEQIYGREKEVWRTRRTTRAQRVIHRVSFELRNACISMQ
jgi:hypothetical protein